MAEAPVAKMPPNERGRRVSADLRREAGTHGSTTSPLIDWLADALEALQVGDIERARRDLNAIHHRLLAEVGR
jgi:hypothetical protein